MSETPTPTPMPDPLAAHHPSAQAPASGAAATDDMTAWPPQRFEVIDQIEPGQSLTVAQGAPADPLWVSALRGRVMAALASSVSLYAAGSALHAQVLLINSLGLTPDSAVAAAQQAAAVTDALTALVVAIASGVALLVSLTSKAREWLRGRGPWS